MFDLRRLAFIAIVIATLQFLGSDQCLGFDQDVRPKISVSGNAEIRVEPDEAVLTFSVDSREEKLDAAVSDNDAKIKAVLEYLAASKVESKHIRTQVISIRPIFEPVDSWRKGANFQVPQAPTASPFNAPMAAPLPGNKKPKIKPIGFAARRQLSITIKDLTAFETIYRGLIERGVNDVGGIEFRTTQLRKHRDEARLKAVRAAREKAEAMANELGAKLDSVHSINEGSSPRWQPSLQNSISISNAPGSSGTLAAGMIEIRANVSVVFILGQTALDAEEQAADK